MSFTALSRSLSPRHVHVRDRENGLECEPIDAGRRSLFAEPVVFGTSDVDTGGKEAVSSFVVYLPEHELSIGL